jgi:hypothetical protein
MSNELRDLFNVEVDEFQKKAKVSTLLLNPLSLLKWSQSLNVGWIRKQPPIELNFLQIDSEKFHLL